MEFDWDDGNWPKCGKHGLSKAEVELVMEFAAVVVPDPHVGEERMNAIGYTSRKADRYAFVVFTMRGERFRPISARYMHEDEVDRYV